MNERIYYCGNYDISSSKYKRSYSRAAIVKMDYIISALNRAGYNVELISASYITARTNCFEKGSKIRINNNTNLYLPSSFSSQIKILRYTGIVFTAFCFFLNLLKIRKGDTLLMYHGDWYYKVITLARKIRKFQLIVDIEEVYTLAFGGSSKKLKREIKFINSSDKYIVVNDLIADKLSIDNKKHIICYGPYSICKRIDEIKFHDNKIHIVYAGSFSKYKGGAHNAIEAANFLNDSYVLHILGFGSKVEKVEIKKRIKEINLTSTCKISYEGEMIGDEFSSFMQGCSIGLNPQRWGDYMNYAFPSKVLSYLCFGLNVVTSPLMTLKASKINQIINYFQEESPQSIAQSILNANIYSREEIINIVKNLDKNFILDLKWLIGSNRIT